MPIFFPRVQQFSPIFRFAEELERASREFDQCLPASYGRPFAPRFDVKETDTAYELNGELPGLDQSNVNIEWTDDTTLSISGSRSQHVEKTNEPETEVKDATPAASEAGEAEEWTDVKEQAQHYRKPSVEEENADNEKASDATEPSNEVTKTEPEKTVAQPAAPKSKYWVSERSYGSFNRTFKFPARVEHDEVKASLKNGVLSVVVPKAKPRELRKVTIN